MRLADCFPFCRVMFKEEKEEKGDHEHMKKLQGGEEKRK